jgi:hypothetical protein
MRFEARSTAALGEEAGSARWPRDALSCNCRDFAAGLPATS